MSAYTPLRHPDGRFRARGAIEALPAVTDRYGALAIPKGEVRQRLGLFTISDLIEYVRTHLSPARYRDFIAGVRDGTTEGNLPLL